MVSGVSFSFIVGWFSEFGTGVEEAAVQAVGATGIANAHAMDRVPLVVYTVKLIRLLQYSSWFQEAPDGFRRHGCVVLRLFKADSTSGRTFWKNCPSLCAESK
jgi:hypothetical protein